MSKPWGMTPSFQIVRPTHVEDKVWDAVETAVDAGWSPEQFMKEIRECWAEYLREKAISDDKAFAKTLKISSHL